MRRAAEICAYYSISAIGICLPWGKVLRIKGFGENRQGDIVYKVVVQHQTSHGFRSAILERETCKVP